MQPITFEQLSNIIDSQIQSAVGGFNHSLKNSIANNHERSFVFNLASIFKNKLSGVQDFVCQMKVTGIIDIIEHAELFEKIQAAADEIFNAAMEYRKPI